MAGLGQLSPVRLTHSDFFPVSGPPPFLPLKPGQVRYWRRHGQIRGHRLSSSDVADIAQHQPILKKSYISYEKKKKGNIFVSKKGRERTEEYPRGFIGG